MDGDRRELGQRWHARHEGRVVGRGEDGDERAECSRESQGGEGRTQWRPLSLSGHLVIRNSVRLDLVLESFGLGCSGGASLGRDGRASGRSRGLGG